MQVFKQKTAHFGKTSLSVFYLLFLCLVLIPAQPFAKKGGVPGHGGSPGHGGPPGHAKKSAGSHGLTISIGQEMTPIPYKKHGPPPWAPAHGYRAKYHYRYYPGLSVYFCLNRGLWFWFGGESWQVGAVLPTRFRLTNQSAFVQLEMSSKAPYQYQKEVQRHYPPGIFQKKP